MKKVACLALVGALGLFGCGGGGSGDDDDDDIVFADAAPQPDGEPTGECNAVSQTGCPVGQKCAVITDQLSDPGTGTPFIGHIGCTPDGTSDLGQACTEAAAVGTADSCKAGGECYNGTCHEICTTLETDNCDGGTCQTFVNGLTEICLVGCDPLNQASCPVANEGCYIARDAVCVVDVSGDQGALGDPCDSANSCDPGMICIGDPGTCHQICGDWTTGFNTDPTDPNLVTWPNCCSSECTEMTVPCTGVNQMCMYLIDMAGNITQPEAGWCAGETEPYVEGIDCDCSLPVGQDKCVDNRMGKRSEGDGLSSSSSNEPQRFVR